MMMTTMMAVNDSDNYRGGNDDNDDDNDADNHDHTTSCVCGIMLN